MLIDLTQPTPYPNDELILKTTTPRPIAWIVTENQNGVINVAPFSLFTPLSFNPVTILISFRAKANGEEKDTLHYIRESKKCTLCMVQESDLEKMHLSANDVAKEISEATTFDIETHILREGYPPIISSSPIAYFCSFEQLLTLNNDTTTPLILTVDEMYIKDEIIKDSETLKIEFNPLSHIFGGEYRGEGEQRYAPKS